MGSASSIIRTVKIPLGVVSLGSVLAVILLMPTILTMLLAAISLVGVLFTLLRNSRRAALSVDIVLIALLVTSHFPPFSQGTPAVPLDIVRLILILSFHEFSSIYSDAVGLELSYTALESASAFESNLFGIRSALVHRTLLVSGVLLLTAMASEAYFLGAKGTSASLYSIYGVAGGLMAVIISLFLLLTIAPRKPGR